MLHKTAPSARLRCEPLGLGIAKGLLESGPSLPHNGSLWLKGGDFMDLNGIITLLIFVTVLQIIREIKK